MHAPVSLRATCRATCPWAGEPQRACRTARSTWSGPLPRGMWATLALLAACRPATLALCRPTCARAPRSSEQITSSSSPAGAPLSPVPAPHLETPPPRRQARHRQHLLPSLQPIAVEGAAHLAHAHRARHARCAHPRHGERRERIRNKVPHRIPKTLESWRRIYDADMSRAGRWIRHGCCRQD